MRVLALDYGIERTGVAISDESGTIARPLTVVPRAASKQGLAELAAIIKLQAAVTVVVGLPVSLNGREHAQSWAVRDFAARLAKVIDVPIVFYDERFTTKVANARGGAAALDARAAATILEGYLQGHGQPG
ncbi:MAG: Holliday junction resolvase RuvX [Thermoleophilia bacterium]